MLKQHKNFCQLPLLPRNAVTKHGNLCGFETIEMVFLIVLEGRCLKSRHWQADLL